MSRKMESEKVLLTDLDNAIADGDHGINMARGFAAVQQKLDNMSFPDLGTLLKTVGMTLVSAVGGSAGPLYGTAFMKCGVLLSEKTEIGMPDFLDCMKAAIEGVMMRGKAVYGEKTMLDAMIPAHEAMRKASEAGASDQDILKAGVSAAWEGVEYTKSIPATKGRASYIGKRSIGHQDPGATSFAFLLETVCQAV